MQWALIDDVTKKIINIIVYDEDSDYEAPEGYSLFQIEDTKHIGDILEY